MIILIGVKSFTTEGTGKNWIIEKFVQIEQLQKSSTLIPSDTLTLTIDIEIFGEPENLKKEISQEKTEEAAEESKSQIKTHMQQQLPSIHSDIAKLYNNELYSDIALHVNGSTIYAHKVILSIRSNYWLNKFNTIKFQLLNIFNATTKNYTVKNISEELFIEVMRFVYTDTCK